MKRRRVPDGIVTSFEPMVTPEDFKNIQEKQKKKDKQEGEEVRQTRKLPLSKCTASILEYLQIQGSAGFRQISDDLDITQRRTSDVLSVLVTTPLVHKQIRPDKNTYNFCAGKLSEPVDIKEIRQEIEKEKKKISDLKKALGKDEE
eukprot:CAMPEP_0206159542 /NCGR_PEP_ID=MMETSP1474-20131121/5932_1 /ASSEMBLY_ACC=CAM_ASM_001110 /TAXON_ID=97495 /ORGANISM="Imantonia sp., Strain RCC918" /LENGTH=145 /DNA_ID=CAMNT_0053560327 /DNA_START=87 /DNA_END=524 /DNA_ORIENTATION=+